MRFGTLLALWEKIINSLVRLFYYSNNIGDLCLGLRTPEIEQSICTIFLLP